MRKYAAIFLVLVASCKHGGVGEGNLRTTSALLLAKEAASGPAKFAWRSGFDRGNGQLEAVLPDRAIYVGPFAQIRAEFDTDYRGRYFTGWSTPTWADDPWFGALPRHAGEVNFPKVVALLKSKEGSLMRCKFELSKPDAGMAGGAAGQCQLADGRMIADATISAR